MSPAMIARRCFANIVSDKLQEALEDAKKAEDIAPGWPIGHYLQAMALLGLGRRLKLEKR